MEPEFIHIEKDLAMATWIIYAFMIYDMLAEDYIEWDGWLKADLKSFQSN